MCDPATIIGITVAAISTATSIATSATQAQQAADRQAKANAIASEQAAAQATAENLQANMAARQRAGAETREVMDINQQAEETQATNTVEFTASGVEGNFVNDVSQALAFSQADAKGAVAAQGMFADNAALLQAGNTAQAHANTIANLPTGATGHDVLGDSIQAGLSGISTGISIRGGVDDILNP